jgi:hypothetical protein
VKFFDMKLPAQKRIISLLLFLMVTGMGGAAYAQERPETFKNDQSVFIMAWKKRGYYDRDLMDQLHKNSSQKSRNQIAKQADAIAGRLTLGNSRMERATLDRPAPFILPAGGSDDDLREKIEEQFIKQKRFKLVAAPEEADIVFLVQGDYIFSFGPRSSDVNDASGPDALARLKAVAIKASTYRDRPSKMLRKLDTAPWRGEEVGVVNYDATFDEASAEKLVKRFHKEALKK